MTPRTALLLALAAALAGCGEAAPRADPRNAVQVERGAKLYAQHCAACHGARLEGQPEWRKRLPNGRMPAPPHDDSGHTWHHAEDVLFGITKLGLVAPYAPKGYESDMPGFGDRLGDEDIWAVLAFIKAHWSPQVQAARAQMLRDRGGR
jgi:mono/diheme cytochrome c family protein